MSVVVPTYKRPDLLSRCLDALARQAYDRRAYEIIVCDDEPGEATAAIVRQYQAAGLPAIRYIPITATQGPAAARNRGWRAARGAVIAFTDDDTIPARRWLCEGEKAFAETGAAAVMGRIVVPLPPRPSDYERDAAGLERAEFATANCFYLRRVLEETGGFDERFGAAWREDADLFFTVLERRGRTARAPAAVVVHPVRPAPWGVSIGQQRKALYNALIYKKHPGLYRQRIQALPPLLYYAVLAGAAAGAAGLWAGSTAALGAGLALWAGGTLWFTARRLRGTSKAPRHIMEMIYTSVLIPPLAVYWRLRGALRYKVLFW